MTQLDQPGRHRFIQSSPTLTPLENAAFVIEAEDWLRSWPYQGQTHDMDERARKVGLQCRRAPGHVQERIYSHLWWIRCNSEPRIADLMRVGLSYDEAEARMDKRLQNFDRAFYGR